MGGFPFIGTLGGNSKWVCKCFVVVFFAPAGRNVYNRRCQPADSGSHTILAPTLTFAVRFSIIARRTVPAFVYGEKRYNTSRREPNARLMISNDCFPTHGLHSIDSAA